MIVDMKVRQINRGSIRKKGEKTTQKMQMGSIYRLNGRVLSPDLEKKERKREYSTASGSQSQMLGA